MHEVMSHLSPHDLDELRRALTQERDRLRAGLTTSEREGRGLAREDNDEIDIAEGVVEQDEGLRLARFDRKLLADVEHALAKLDKGTYGTSEQSGEPIALERLRAMPWARRTREEEEARTR
jgi:DnaK suppressor protein